MAIVQPAQDVPDPQALLVDWQAWLLRERCLSPLTAQKYGWRMNYFLRLCKKNPLDVSTSDLRQHLLAVCPKPNTKHAALRAFRSFFGFLAAEGYRDDPSRAIRAPKVPDSMRTSRWRRRASSMRRPIGKASRCTPSVVSICSRASGVLRAATSHGERLKRPSLVRSSGPA